MANYTILCWKILGETGKQEILQIMFQKFNISNRLPNRYFPKIEVGCPWKRLDCVASPNRYFTENSRWVPLCSELFTSLHVEFWKLNKVVSEKCTGQLIAFSH